MKTQREQLRDVLETFHRKSCYPEAMDFEVDYTINKIEEILNIQKAKEILESKWDSEGGCNSCGYHACLYEHGVDDSDIRDAIIDDGILHLSCRGDDEDSDRHRGININISVEKE